MNRTQDTIILEKIFNERLELSIYKNRGQFYLTKNLRKQFRHKIEINIDVKNQKRLIIKELDEGNVQQNFYSKKLAQHISDLVGVNGNMKFLFIRDEADNCWIGVLLPEMAGSYLWDINMCQKKEYLPKDYKEEIIISIYRKFWNLKSFCDFLSPAFLILIITSSVDDTVSYIMKKYLRSAFKLLATYFTFLIILSLRRKKKWILCSFYSS